MKISSMVACVFLLLSLILMLTLPSNSFFYIQSAYATPGGGDDSDGDGDGDGDFSYSRFPDGTGDLIHILGPKSGSGKKNFTAADLIAARESRDKGITVVIVGAGKGLEDEILNLAEHNPILAAKLLSKWSRLRARDLKGLLKKTEKIANQINLALKLAKAAGASAAIISPLQNTYDALLNLGDGIIIIGLGGGGLSTVPSTGGPVFQSDVRLKKEVIHIATLKSGIRLYSFQYLWDDKVYVGVMAQDLLGSAATREAVSTMPDGFYAVNYEMLGLKMTSLDSWRKQGLSSVLVEPATANASVLQTAFEN